ncbi:MAG: hypothetical protein OXR68_04780 [Alphaproteobacteria bacterium]|nr:hypothetical protein [Alphaproteobacteria bacterium]MDD9919924.1 hypothetical protein [Alphaproteobacteria bacterium]
MTRFVLIALLNLMLPFLIRAAWLLVLRQLHRRKVKKYPEIIDVTPAPKWDFPILRLLVIGILLLTVALTIFRILNTEKNINWQPANPAVSKEY